MPAVCRKGVFFYALNIFRRPLFPFGKHMYRQNFLVRLRGMILVLPFLWPGGKSDGPQDTDALGCRVAAGRKVSAALHVMEK